jgi:sec-independent protein translocase protein TatA
MGLTEFLIIAAIVLLAFGGSRIPALLRSLGESKAEYKRGISGAEDQDADVLSSPKKDA